VIVSPFDFSAAGDGVQDDTVCVQMALDSGNTVDGGDHWFGIHGSLTLPPDASLHNIKLKQLDPSPDNTRTIVARDGGRVTLTNIVVDRNGTGYDGSFDGPACGIHIANADGVLLEDVEVYGASKGFGIHVLGSSDVWLTRPHVHDLRWDAPNDPGGERIVGIFVQNSTDVQVSEPRIRNLMGIINGTTYGDVRDNYQTDGLDFANSSRFTVRGGIITKVWEGIDITGSGTNARFVLDGIILEDIYAFGIKLAHVWQDAAISNCIVRNAGLGGFIASADPSARAARFTNCQAINTGSNGIWEAMNIAGFKVTGPANSVVFNGCLAADYQNTPTMKYGFCSGVPSGPSKPPRIFCSTSEGAYGLPYTGNFATTQVF
jgi:hypothetical protein